MREKGREREMADIDAKGFLDFFASPSLSHAGSHPITSTFNTTTVSHPPPQPSVADNDDDDWGDFMGPASRSNPSPNSTSHQFDFASSNGTETAFDPLSFVDRSFNGLSEAKLDRIGFDSKGIGFEKPRGPLPLSLFGEDEEESGGSKVNSPVNGSNVSLDQKSSQVAVNGTSSDPKIGGSEILAKLHVQNPQIEHQSASNSDTNGLYSVSKSDTYPNGPNEVSDDEDDWEFRGAFSQDGVGETNFEEQGGSEVSGSKAGEDASKFVMNNLESVNSRHQFADLFATQNGSSNKNSAVNNLESMNSSHQFPDLFASQNGSSNKNSAVNNLEPMNSPYQNDDLFASQNGASNIDSEVNSPKSTNRPHQFADLFASQNGSSHKNSEVNNLDMMNSPHQFANLFALQNGASNTNSEVNNLELSNSPHQFADLFASQNGVSNKNSELNVGTDLRATSFFPDAFMAFPLTNALETGNANVTYPSSEITNDDFDDFGEFMDAASDPTSNDQKHHPILEASFEAPVQNGSVVDRNTRPESLTDAFPESIFSNGVESNEHHISVTDKPTFVPKNGTTLRSEKSVQDLILNLYAQSQDVPSADSSEKPENSSCTILKTLDSSSDKNSSYGNNNSWENKEVGVKEKSNDAVQKESDELQDLQIFVDFFASLRDKLYFLASRLLEDSENNEAQEAHRTLQDDIGSEIHLEKDMPISGCLSDFIEVLHGPTFRIIESEYVLSKRLSLAEKDWRLAIKLLKETKLIAKILESSSSDDHSAYISTWSIIVHVCAEELRYGALIWKQAVENSLQIQILSDHRGQRYIHGLGEIYRVIQLIGLSAKVYKPWMLLNKGDQSSLFLVLDECSALWSSSGLEEAFWNLLGSVDSASGQSVEALLESIKHIQETDVLAMQDCAFFQQKSVCQLSLLPEQMLPELNLVSWNGIRCFLKVANCWANLISHEPPFLPHIRVG